MRADAHTLYARTRQQGPLRRGAETSGADVVGGLTAPVPPPRSAGPAAVTSSPVGVGPGRFHYADEAGGRRHGYLGTYRRDVVTEVGATETTSGGRPRTRSSTTASGSRAAIRLDPSIRSQYLPARACGRCGRALQLRHVQGLDP